ncbi:MAG: ATP-binding cassette domain-containing protein [Saprospiraceae bacterium]
METGAIVSFQDVDIYQAQYLILHDVNLTLHPSEFCYLIGKTGSGKSSLLKTMYGALPLYKGSAMVAGYDLGKLNRKQIPLMRRELGMVFQDFNLLYDRNVEDNLGFVLKATGWKESSDIKRRIEEVLDSVGLKYIIHKMPHELSGGEQQRVAIARALLNTPQLIIADEPTGNLDPETSDEIMTLLRNICIDNKTPVLVATHDYRLIEKFPGRVVRCSQGQVNEFPV